MIKKYDAKEALSNATKRNKIHLNILIAETSLWANPKVYEYLLAENGSGAYYPNIRRGRISDGEKKGMEIDSIQIDDNTYANNAIKKAVGIPKENLLGYSVCHIWPLTCYDVRYHTNIANLVLMPSALAGLSDHDAESIATLQYRAYELYNWYPKEEKSPKKPSYYPNCWTEPLPFTAQIEKSLKRRAVAKQYKSNDQYDRKIIKSNNQVKSQRDIRYTERKTKACSNSQFSKRYANGSWIIDMASIKLEQYNEHTFTLKNYDKSERYRVKLPTQLIIKLLSDGILCEDINKKNITLKFTEEAGTLYLRDKNINRYIQ